MTQKVIRIGSSAGVTIPKEKLEELGLKIGDRVEISVRPVSKPSQGDREVLQWTVHFIERYRTALEALAKQ